MITKEQALNNDYFHLNGCNQSPDGPRGGKGRIKIIGVRRNGATQTWKTRPTEWRLPVKYGFYSSGAYSITQREAHDYHVTSECPLLEQEKNHAVAN